MISVQYPEIPTGERLLCQLRICEGSLLSEKTHGARALSDWIVSRRFAQVSHDVPMPLVQRCSSTLARTWPDRFLKRLIENLQINMADLFAQLVVFGALLFADRLVLLPPLLCGHA